jgi:hypothetical protein
LAVGVDFLISRRRIALVLHDPIDDLDRFPVPKVKYFDLLLFEDKAPRKFSKISGGYSGNSSIDLAVFAGGVLWTLSALGMAWIPCSGLEPGRKFALPLGL